eukprot:3583684-Amphidinium_carterae.1
MAGTALTKQSMEIAQASPTPIVTTYNDGLYPRGIFFTNGPFHFWAKSFLLDSFGCSFVLVLLHDDKYHRALAQKSVKIDQRHRLPRRTRPKEQIKFKYHWFRKTSHYVTMAIKLDGDAVRQRLQCKPSS